ncbi:uncharacterized protein LOC113274365 isoform X1 [Papaver somniferum]|uniref:uncharacterized protein LOC113274365 isoform X1 n=1 Tax=Papaver somniferum TaxID=3469 RepID=UPI000E705C9A|nr:uncharacterized protein LOC113274365 isoform X1 [Papaver somniferum]
MADISNSKTLHSTDVSDPSLGGSKRLRRVLPRRKTEPKEEHTCTTKELHDLVRPYAMDAISFYSEITGTKYELVEPGYIAHALLLKCLVHHLDFTAKKTDVDDAPEEIFFAELTTINKEIKNNGCRYCMNYNVQHPRDGGFMARGAGLFRDEPNDIPRRERNSTSTGSHDVVRPYAVDARSVYNERTPKIRRVQNMSLCSLVTLRMWISGYAFFTISTSRLKRLMLLMLQRRCFFAELTTINKVSYVKACRCMGPKIVISGDKNSG